MAYQTGACYVICSSVWVFTLGAILNILFKQTTLDKAINVRTHDIYIICDLDFHLYYQVFSKYGDNIMENVTVLCSIYIILCYV